MANSCTHADVAADAMDMTADVAEAAKEDVTKADAEAMAEAMAKAMTADADVINDLKP